MIVLYFQLDTNQGRFVLEANGDLTIVQVKETDSGTYVCVASNGLGAPVQREITLNVQSKYTFFPKACSGMIFLLNLTMISRELEIN